MMKNKVLSTVLFSIIFALSVSCQTSETSAKSCKFLSSADAEKILGGKADLVATESASFNGKTKFECTYRRIEKEKASGKEANLYFMVEESATEKDAEQVYAEIWNSNKNHRGIEILNGIGNEAYSHGEKPNFYFVMARKGKFTVRIKVNKAVEGTSFAELKEFVKRTVEAI